MNKGLYKHKDGKCIYWYKKWKNSSENSGVTVAIWGWDLPNDNKWSWINCGDDNEEDSGDCIGAACLAQW